MRCQLGLVNLAAAPLLELDADEVVLTETYPIWDRRLLDLAPTRFRDRAAGWVARGRTVPFVRILEVRDATPEEVAADEARRAANL